jgi:hypothetical protein
MKYGQWRGRESVDSPAVEPIVAVADGPARADELLPSLASLAAGVGVTEESDALIDAFECPNDSTGYCFSAE